ncbi:coiled-coil domain-containing protein 81 [Mustela nigripes]|uniref:coiled-coil domain-containing protein 81 n=1 Tax=Mustela nigripes TaxID=77151 RepID=UPI002815DE5E|nr:coiled-coil domain-containing protein 81 [Mustela nigripes]
MLDTIVPSVQDLGRQVLPTLLSLSQEEVSAIWANVSEFVERQLSLHKGVQIPGLGTFTFMRQKLEVGNNKFILIQRPMFIMAEKLVQIHGLKQNKIYIPGDIPVVPLNFVMISLEGPFSRDTVEGCVKETLLFLSRSISIKRNVEFTFKGIGVLVIKGNKVKMRFYKDFLCSVDGSGTLAKALANKSFLFDKRPLSPEINALKQEEYSQNLLKQMDNRREKEIKQRQNRELMERLEQVQLTEELAAQRAQYIKDKMEETQCYKRALDAQIKNKPLQLPMFEPDSSEPIFGKDEGELMVEKQKQEQNYMKHQLEAAASHRRRTILQQLVEQKRDLQMLRRTQRERLADRNAELERVNRINQSLQEDWESSAAMKRQRDLEEKAFERASDKLFLLDQCEKYRRCKQCQRRTSNVGESNLWPLNKHLHGSRLFI